MIRGNGRANVHLFISLPALSGLAQQKSRNVLMVPEAVSPGLNRGGFCANSILGYLQVRLEDVRCMGD